MSSTSEGHAAEFVQNFSNGFTLGVYLNGVSWTSGNQGGQFALDGEVPLTLTIDGPSRNLVVLHDGVTSEVLSASAGTVGQVLYGFNDFTVISRSPNGGDAVSFDYESTGPTSTELWTTDEAMSHNFGVSMQVRSSITAGDLFSSMQESETYRFYEADGVTPVDVRISETPEPGSFILLLGAIPLGLLAAWRRRSVGVQH